MKDEFAEKRKRTTNDAQSKERPEDPVPIQLYHAGTMLGQFSYLDSVG